MTRGFPKPEKRMQVPYAAPILGRTHYVHPMLYHGTDVCFQPGDIILPGSKIGRRNHKLSEDVVYLSSFEGIALVFAQDFKKKQGRSAKVFEVEPLGTVMKSEPHIADSEHSSEWSASSARVIRRVH